MQQEEKSLYISYILGPVYEENRFIHVLWTNYHILPRKVFRNSYQKQNIMSITRESLSYNAAICLPPKTYSKQIQAKYSSKTAMEDVRTLKRLAKRKKGLRTVKADVLVKWCPSKLMDYDKCFTPNVPASSVKPKMSEDKISTVI